jgi:hypothetical protein
MRDDAERPIDDDRKYGEHEECFWHQHMGALLVSPFRIVFDCTFPASAIIYTFVARIAPSYTLEYRSLFALHCGEMLVLSSALHGYTGVRILGFTSVLHHVTHDFAVWAVPAFISRLQQVYFLLFSRAQCFES